MCSDLLSQETHSVDLSLTVFPSKQYFILCSSSKSSIQFRVLSEVYFFFLFRSWRGGWNGWKLSTSFQKHKTLFLSNFSRYSICFSAGIIRCGAGRAAQNNTPVNGSGKRVSQMCANQTGTWSELVSFYSGSV